MCTQVHVRHLNAFIKTTVVVRRPNEPSCWLALSASNIRAKPVICTFCIYKLERVHGARLPFRMLTCARNRRRCRSRHRHRRVFVWGHRSKLACNRVSLSRVCVLRICETHGDIDRVFATYGQMQIYTHTHTKAALRTAPIQKSQFNGDGSICWPGSRVRRDICAVRIISCVSLLANPAGFR